jgi:hypothetical protein
MYKLKQYSVLGSFFSFLCLARGSASTAGFSDIGSSKQQTRFFNLTCKTPSGIKGIQIPKQIVQKGLPQHSTKHLIGKETAGNIIIGGFLCYVKISIIWKLEPAIWVNFPGANEDENNKWTHGQETNPDRHFACQWQTAPIDKKQENGSDGKKAKVNNRIDFINISMSGLQEVGKKEHWIMALSVLAPAIHPKYPDIHPTLGPKAFSTQATPPDVSGKAVPSSTIMSASWINHTKGMTRNPNKA